jgi:hypothetical protein
MMLTRSSLRSELALSVANGVTPGGSSLPAPAVMLSEAKQLAAQRDRPFAEFPLSEANGLRVTR